MQKEEKYLKIVLDKSTTFERHLAETSGRAVKVKEAVEWLMPNIG